MPLKILAFDTSTSVCTVALSVGGRHFIRENHEPKQHALVILSMIDELLAEAQLTGQELTAIAYGCGPGSFTGLRIGNSVAQALSYAWKVPIVRVSSLAIIAQSAFKVMRFTKVTVGVDVHMNQLYLGHYTASAEGLMVASEADCAYKTDAVRLRDTKWALIGEVFSKYQLNNEQKVHQIKPCATELLTLAHHKVLNSDFTSCYEAIPHY